MIKLKINKKWYLCATAGIVAVALLFVKVDNGQQNKRYEQHLSQPSELELAEKPDSKGLVTHLPIISIDTDGQKIPGKAIIGKNNSEVGVEKGENGEENIVAKMKTMEKEGQWHQETDEADIESDILIHIRGNSSRTFDKSSYRIELVKEKNPELKNKQPLLGMKKSSSWALYGPYLDKTLIRNYMWMNISGRIMGYAPNVRFCELMLDGEYQGVYVLMEIIEMSEERLNLFPYTPGDPVMSYVVCIDSPSKIERTVDSFSFYTKRLEQRKRYEIVYPGVKEQTQQVKDYISMDISEIEHAIYSYHTSNDPGFYLKYLDENSFVDYYILQEFLGNIDTYKASTYFYKDIRGKLQIGPVWDYNNVLNNFFQSQSAERFLLTDRGFYSQLMKSSRFVNQVIRRYRELRKSWLSEEYLLSYIDETEEWLGSAIDRNFEVWGYTFDWTKMKPYARRIPDLGETNESVNPSSYAEANESMKEYLVTRGRWMDQNIESLKQYCHESKNVNTALY